MPYTRRDPHHRNPALWTCEDRDRSVVVHVSLRHDAETREGHGPVHAGLQRFIVRWSFPRLRMNKLSHGRNAPSPKTSTNVSGVNF